MKRTTSYVAAGAIALALMGCGATADTNTDTATEATGIDYGGNTEPDTTTEEVTVQTELSDWWLENKDAWKLMQQRLSAIDLPGAVEAMNTMTAIPDPEAQRLWIKYQQNLNLAATAYEMGDVVTATDYVNKATPYMTAMTKYVEGLA